MAVLYNLLYLVLIGGPLGVFFWQLYRQRESIRHSRVVALSVVFIVIIVFEVALGKADHTQLFYEKMAAVSALVSLFSFFGLLMLKKNRLILAAIVISLLMALLFSVAGYRNFSEATCYLLRQQCFGYILMYRR